MSRVLAFYINYHKCKDSLCFHTPNSCRMFVVLFALFFHKDIQSRDQCIRERKEWTRTKKKWKCKYKEDKKWIIFILSFVGSFVCPRKRNVSSLIRQKKPQIGLTSIHLKYHFSFQMDWSYDGKNFTTFLNSQLKWKKAICQLNPSQFF